MTTPDTAIAAALAANGKPNATIIKITPLLIDVENTRVALGGLSRANTYRLINEGELDTIKLGGRRLIVVESIQRLIDRNRVGAH